MRLLCLLVALFLSMNTLADAQGYLTRDILSRVKKIKVGPATGSAFIIEVDNRQYVITAKHVVASVTGDQIDVEFFENKSSKKIAMREDVSVAFIRKATYSAQERGDGWLRIYLDGRNNVGFSGGPVLIYDLSKQGHPLKLIGVVSAYRNEPTEVMKLEPVEEKDITPADRASERIVTLANGKFAKLIGTGNFVLNNSGIVHAYGLRAAIDLIRTSGGPGPAAK